MVACTCDRIIIFILGVEWCDLIVYSNNAVVVDHILADLEYWNELEQVLEDFNVHYVIPEILSRTRVWCNLGIMICCVTSFFAYNYEN